jgi:hypothetical protein
MNVFIFKCSKDRLNPQDIFKNILKPMLENMLLNVYINFINYF